MLAGHKSIQLPIKWFIIMALIAGLQQTNGKRIKLLPLSAANVYSILKESRSLDAVPEGRVVTQAVAAAGGFALGLTKSLAGVFLYEIITANITEPDESQPQSFLTQEICFGTRAGRSYEESDAEAIADTYIRLGQGVADEKADVRKSKLKRRSRPFRRNKHRFKTNNRKPSRRRRLGPERINDVTSKGGMDTLVTSNPLTTAVTGTGETAGTDTGTGTNTATGLGQLTTLSTTTTTGNEREPITCIVVQRPKQ